MGLEPTTFTLATGAPTEANECANTDLQNATQSDAGNMQETRQDGGTADSELAEIRHAWPMLPEPVRAGILAMVRAASEPRG